MRVMVNAGNYAEQSEVIRALVNKELNGLIFHNDHATVSSRDIAASLEGGALLFPINAADTVEVSLTKDLITQVVSAGGYVL